MPNSPIGLIGVGLLGTALAERMLEGGLPVVGYDLDDRRLHGLAGRGGMRASGALVVARACRTIVLCLPDSTAVSKVVDECLPYLHNGSLLIDATTGDPSESIAVAARIRGRAMGHSYLDATIAGSSEQARQGEAVVMCGGEQGDVERAEPVLATWSPRRFHLGPVGSGARMKLIVNLVLGLNRAVLAEGLSLAKACDMDLKQALVVLQATPAYSAIMDPKGYKMINEDFAPQARLSQHLKDVGLIRQLARQHGALTPFSNLHEELLHRAVALGLGEMDNSAIIKVFSPPDA